MPKGITVEPDHYLAVTLPTAVLGLVLLVLVSLGIGIGAGFYFGSKTNQAGEVITICNAMANAYEGQISGLQVNYDIVLKHLTLYEDSLTNIGVAPATTIAKLRELRPGMGGK